jgi:hypothetical protein
MLLLKSSRVWTDLAFSDMEEVLKPKAARMKLKTMAAHVTHSMKKPVYADVMTTICQTWLLGDKHGTWA